MDFLRLFVRHFKEIIYAFGFLFAIMVIGVLGFTFIEDFSIWEAWYMTVITVSTVGFNEVKPLSESGQIFTSTLIIFSFGTFAYVASSLTNYIISGRYAIYIKEFRVSRTIEQLGHHVIICGYGDNGYHAAKTLKAHGKNIVVIESDADKIELLRKQGEIAWIHGDATDEENILKAGIKKADSLISTLPSDANNLFVVLTARELNDNLKIISRAISEKTEKKLRVAGADNVILPDRVGGTHMASLVVTPDISEFLDKLSVVSANEKVNLEEVMCSGLRGDETSLSEIENIENRSLRVLGIKRTQGEYILNPTTDEVVFKGDKLFVLGSPEDISALAQRA